MTDRQPPAIHISQEVVESEAVPDDLDSWALGPYEFPSPRRRRSSALVYAIGAILAGAGALSGLPGGMWVVASSFGALAVWAVVTAWPLEVGDEEALEAAAKAVSFPVGHSSGAVRFEGLRARPVWNVLMYSADDPPSKRGLVLIDGSSGELRVEPYEEDL